jgi:hypothetical protein
MENWVYSWATGKNMKVLVADMEIKTNKVSNFRTHDISVYGRNWYVSTAETIRKAFGWHDWSWTTRWCPEFDDNMEIKMVLTHNNANLAMVCWVSLEE